MPDSPVIQPAEEKDLPAILDLTHRAYARNVGLGFRYTGAFESMEALSQAWREGKVFKLQADGRIRGTIRLTNQPEGWLDVWRLCIEPESQRRGLGSLLLRFTEDEARRRGLPRLRLNTAKPYTE